MASFKGDPWGFWASIGRPRWVVAPMVDQSELPFRMLTRHYGAELVYTPMLHARLFGTSAEYRERHFRTCPGDRPLFAQFAGDEGARIAEAANLLSGDQVDAIDINFGCPQGIAKRGHYGAFLLEDPDLVEAIVRHVAAAVPLPLAVKLRKLHKTDLSPTVRLCQRLEAAGAAVLCLHGRTKEERAQQTLEPDWDAVRVVKAALNIPVIANGGIETLDDAQACLAQTGADAVMAAEAALGNPALFAGRYDRSQSALAAEYMASVDRHGVERGTAVKAHLFRLLHHRLLATPSLREQLGQSCSMADYRSVVAAAVAEEDTPLPPRAEESYYRRHRRAAAAAAAAEAEESEEEDDEPLGLDLLD